MPCLNLINPQKAMSMKNNKYITVDSEVMSGRPVFTETRVPVDDLFEYIESGLTIDNFVADFPLVTKEMVINVIESLH